MSNVIDLSSLHIPDFRKQLISWFKINKRDLPWREAGHWYPVFLSEFLLQQTQVDQALPYFNKFIHRYPDIKMLADASEQAVLHLWAGLGYYSRARNLLKAAVRIRDQFAGEFPADYRAACSLPGIGDYTASAILSIAFNKPFPVVDGNVLRVITRILGIADDIRLTKTHKLVKEICSQLIDSSEPGNFNEGIMELGAVICTPRKPVCEQCPVKDQCRAKKAGSIEKIPFKSPPAPKKTWNHLVIVPQAGDKFLIVKRNDSGLLASLWEFPAMPVENLDIKSDEISKQIKEKFGFDALVKATGSQMVHVYSHIKLNFRPILVRADGIFKPEITNYTDFVWESQEQLSDYPIHNAHKKIIGWLENQKLNPSEI